MQITQRNRTDIAINCFHHDGGMKSYTFDLVRSLRARGVEVAVYAAQADPAIPEYNQVGIHRINQQIIPKRLRPYFFTHQLTRTRRGRNAPFITCNPGNRAGTFVCDDTHLGYLHNMGKQPGLLDRLTVRRNRSNCATAKSIMAHSHLIQRELTTLYDVPPEKIRVIHLPAGTARFRPAPSETATVRAKYGFRDDETVFLFPSTDHKRRRLDLLADFFGHTDLPVRLAVAGSPLPRPMESVVGLGLYTNMPELYRITDFAVMASLYGPFELVGVESVLCGTRVILSDNIACTEVMNDEASFFFLCSRPETLAQVVAQATVLKQQGRHKIADPMWASTYNSTLEHHINQTVAMLGAV